MSIIIDQNTNTFIKNTTTTTGADSVLGGLDADLIDGLAGNDTIDGQGGDDGINGGDGNDTINGSMGDDTILGDAGNDVIDGDQGEDHIDGGAGDDTLRGGIEDDVIEDLVGNNSIEGGDANDSITAGVGNDIIVGGSGNDVINAGDGNNKINGNISSSSISASTGTGNDKITAGTGNDSITGGSGNDTIDAGSGDNWIYDNGGTNSITTGAGKDSITGGSGNDTIIAGDGNNSVIGGSGNDTITTGIGNDSIDGGAGTDSITAGAGNDTITGDATDSIDGGTGDDTFKLTLTGTGGSVKGGDGDDSFEVANYSYSGAISVDGGAGKDTYKLNPTASGQFIITNFTAGAGGDFIDVIALLTASKAVAVTGYSGGNPFATDQGYFILEQSGADALLKFDKDGKNGFGNTPVTLITFKNLQKSALTSDNFSYNIKPDGSKVDGKTLVGTASADTYTLENLSTSLFDDTITGNAGDDSIKADGGADSIAGNDGNDTIYGGSGNDTIDGGLGNDYIYGEEGNDSIIGGEGNNTISAGEGANTITTGSGADTINAGSDNDSINAGDGSNSITDNGGTNSITTGSGADTIKTGYGADTINAGEGNNYIQDSGGTNTITTGAGADMINGGSGNDTINAGDGNNYIQDSGGTNTITTGSGNDTIGTSGSGSITSGAGNDILTLQNSGGTVDAGDGDDSVVIFGSNFSVKGGNGSDLYTLKPNAVNVSIADFKAGSAGDMIDLTYLLEYSADQVNGGYVGGNPFASDQGYLSLDSSGSDTLLKFDADGKTGSATAQTVLILKSVAKNTITADNFIDRINPDGSVINGMSLTGTASVDSISPKSDKTNTTTNYSNDTITGLAGNDSIYGKGGHDNIDAGEGNDLVDGGMGNDTMLGGDGNDSLIGAQGHDSLVGGAGDDTITDLSMSNETIDGGEGNNKITDNGGTNTITTGAGADTINGGSGNDTITAGEGNNTITDNGGTNSITTGAGIDKITAGYGNDTINAGNGNNTITDSGGTNTITTGTGADTIYGGYGNDSIASGDGDDSITAGAGKDTVTAGAGNDTITADESDELDGGAGDNIFKLKNQANDTVTGGKATGGAGKDLFEVITPTSVNYYNSAQDFPNYNITGGAGIDTYKPLPSLLLTVSDFKVGAGGDMINITNMLNFSANLGKAKGGYSGGNPFNSKQVYLKLEQHDKDTWLLFDPDGTASSTNSLKKVMVLKNVKVDDLTSDNIVKDVGPTDPPVPVDPKGTDPSDPVPVDTTPPVLQDISTDGTKIILRYDETLDSANPPALSTFLVSLNDAVITPTSISITDKVIFLTLPQTVTQSDDLVISYKNPTTGNDLKATQDKAGNDSADFSNHAIDKKTLNIPFVLTDTKANDTFVSQSQTLSPNLTGVVTYTLIDTKGVKSTSITTDYGILSVDKLTSKITLDSSSKAVDTKIESLTSNGAPLSFKLSASNGKETQEGVVSINVIGVDDLTDFTGTKTGSVTKNDIKTSKVTGTITPDDRDTPLDKKIVAVSEVKGVYGTFSISATGVWSYTLDNTKGAPVYALKAGEQQQDIFTVKTAGNSSEKVTITVNGADDSLISDPSSPPLDPAKPFYLGSGRIDADTIILYYNKVVDKNNLADISAFELNTKRVDGTKQSIAPISMTSNLNQVILKINSADMLYTKDLVTITYTDPTTGDDTKAIQDTTGVDAKTTTLGLRNNTISFTDTSKADNIPAKAIPGYLSTPISGASYSILSNGKSVPTLSTDYGTFAIDAKTGIYNFTPTGLAIESLTSNTSLSFTIQALKDKVVVNTEEVKVYLIGANDQAIFKGTGEQKTTVKDAKDPSIAKGKVSASDVDKGSNATIKGQTTDTDYGTFMLQTDGSWVYTLKNESDKVNKLGNGQTYKEIIPIQTIDGDTDTITIKVIGSNDASIITGDTKGVVKEDETIMAIGQLTITDIDEGEDQLAVVQFGKDKTTRVDLTKTSSVEGKYGTLNIDTTGKWEYTLHNDDLLVQALYDVDAPIETFYFYPIENLEGKLLGDSSLSLLPNNTQKIEITVQGQGKKINGTPKNDTALLGSDQEDSINGGAGSDSMYGGLGDDIYVLSVATDSVFENPDEGNDTLIFDYVFSSPYVLPINLENITVNKITAVMMLTGNTANNIMIANSNFNDLFNGLDGNDVFDAGKGKNLLTGGSGADAFISGGISKSEVMLGRQINTITDFSSAEGDKIRLVADANTFSQLLAQAGSTLTNDQLAFGTAASSANSYVIYDQNTGNLYYDADGNGNAKKQQLIATLSNKVTLTESDIQIVGIADAYLYLP